jgi:hypothetical protein
MIASSQSMNMVHSLFADTAGGVELGAANIQQFHNIKNHWVI